LRGLVIQKNKPEALFKSASGTICMLFLILSDSNNNFYNNRSSNAAAESFNAKIKQFRTALRGVADEKFFLFRIAKIYGYPQ